MSLSLSSRVNRRHLQKMIPPPPISATASAMKTGPAAPVSQSANLVQDRGVKGGWVRVGRVSDE